MKIEQADFNQEGRHQWTLNHENYRVVIRRVDGVIDITIRAKITGDPDLQEWKTALATVNTFYEELRIANVDTPPPDEAAAEDEESQ